VTGPRATLDVDDRMSDFQAFCSAVRRWLASENLLDPSLAAAVDLLARRDPRGGQWFECEVSHIAARADDMHAAFGAQVLLEIWSATGVRPERA
jgi:hypothetical protein